PSPLPYADFVTTTTHKTLRGPRGGMILCREAYAKAIDSAVFPGQQGGPLMHIIAAKAVAFLEALQPSFKDYQQQTVRNAAALAAGLNQRGFDLISGGTDTHLMLVDLRNTGLTGKVMQLRLDSANITCNKNGIPNDPQTPFVTSGIRLGTPAVTTRGMNEDDMDIIAELISMAREESEEQLQRIRDGVAELCARYPLYPEL
ncbi:MAG: serine hydroxymethyltransferase, partial [Eubacteriales bacterium]|nr:serine hydroxymethyltransferase [Eubacteriales bacterium]